MDLTARDCLRPMLERERNEPEYFFDEGPPSSDSNEDLLVDRILMQATSQFAPPHF